MIGEEGKVDRCGVDENLLVEGFDQEFFDHFNSTIPERLRNATLEDLTVWVDPLDGTKVGTN